VTRPIFEPTTPRTLSAEGYQRRQLLRRPATSGCPCPLEWAYAEDADSDDIPNNTLTDVTFTSYAIAPSNEAIVINSATKPFKLVQSGWYHFWVESEWTGAGFSDQRMTIMSETGGGFWINNSSSVQPHISASDIYLSSLKASWGPLYSNCNSANNQQLGIQVHQKSGSTQTLTSTKFSVVYLGPALDIPDYVASWYGDYLVSF